MKIIATNTITKVTTLASTLKLGFFVNRPIGANFFLIRSLITLPSITLFSSEQRLLFSPCMGCFFEPYQFEVN